MEVFNWGIRNKGGKLRSSQIKNLREKMFPQSTASLNSKGIEFKKGWYTAENNATLIELQLKTQKRKIKITVSYDPYNLNTLNVFCDDEIVQCDLNTNRSPIYKDKTIWDINQLIKAKSISLNTNNDDKLFSAIDSLEFAADLIRRKKNTSKTKSSSKKSITQAREVDKTIERLIRQRETVKPDVKPKEGKIISINKNNLNHPDDLDFIDDLLNGE